MTSKSHFLLVICLVALFSYSLQDDVCTNVDCGEGKCVVDPLIPLVYSCDCNPGWQTIKVGPMPIGTCVIPNCSLDFSCGGKNPPTPPFPPINFTSPCNLVWCGDGDCVVNGTGHYCQCHERAANLFNNPQFVCFQQCYLGGDCKHVSLGPTPPPPPSSVASPGSGKNDASYPLTKLHVVFVLVFTTIFL